MFLTTALAAVSRSTPRIKEIFVVNARTSRTLSSVVVSYQAPSIIPIFLCIFSSIAFDPTVSNSEESSSCTFDNLTCHQSAGPQLQGVYNVP